MPELDTLGYIWLHRKIRDNEVFNHDLTAWHVFEVLMVHVDRHTGSWRGGRFTLAGLCHMKDTTVYKALKRLEKAKMVTLDSNSKYTTIYLCKWDSYQPSGNSASNNIVTTEGQRSNTITIRKKKEERNKNNSLLSTIIAIINPKEKPTDTRQRKLNTLSKDYTDEEITSAAKAFAASVWHRENKQMSVDNLLAPSKFGRWYVQDTPVEATDEIEYTQADKLIEAYEKAEALKRLGGVDG